ncbi:MAG: AAA family ATPase [Planctomycetes bacterium]|nr:AAA family ATPase [Planctomycetota bacterium]
MTKALTPTLTLRGIMEDKRSLSLVHWGLERWPFRGTPRVDQLYPTAGLTEALARIDYLVDGRRRMGVILGESGVGKSVALQSAARQLERQGRAVVAVDATAVTAREMAWLVACGLGAGPHEDADVAKLWRQIADRVVENRLQQRHTALLVDEAGQAGPDVISQFVRLARLDPSPSARWTIVLAAEPEQAARWGRALRNLVDLRIDLMAWNADDTIGYIQMALLDAGRMEPLFEDDALTALYRLTQGVPRQVVRLADFALLASAAAGMTTIDAVTIEAAHDELAWPIEAAAY